MHSEKNARCGHTREKKKSGQTYGGKMRVREI